MNQLKKLETSKGPIEYRDEGSGPAVVFVHGFLVDGELWRKVWPQLVQKHRCIVPNWPVGSHRLPMNPGADLSPLGIAALVAEVLERLELRDVTLVGNDTGGAISQLVTARHGERVGRLLLTNCDAFEVFPPPAFSYLHLLPRLPGLMTLMAKVMRGVPVLRRLPLAYGGLARTPIPDELMAAWVTPAADSPEVRRDIITFLRGVSTELTQAAARELKILAPPTLLVWGTADPFFKLSLAERLRDTIPGARLQPVPDSGTFVSEDAPDVLAAAIADFCTVPGRGAVPQTSRAI